MAVKMVFLRFFGKGRKNWGTAPADTSLAAVYTQN